MQCLYTKCALLVEIIKPDDINSYVLSNGIEWNHRGVPKTLTARNLNMMTLKNFDQSYKTFEDALLSDQYGIIYVGINFGLFFVLAKMNVGLLHNMISMLHLRTHYDLVLLYGCAYNYLFKNRLKIIEAADKMQYELGLETGK